MESVKELIKNVKALFNAPIPAPVVPAAPVAVEPVALVATPFKLKDGTDISITMAGAEIAVGDSVMIAGAPATEGEYEMEDGSKVKVDAMGIVTEVIPVEPATQPDFQAPAISLEDRIKAIESRLPAQMPAQMAATIPATTVGSTSTEVIQAAYAAFATGSTDERVANLEVVAKALMEYSFGWQIREAEQKAAADQAINVYKQGLVNAEAKMTKQDEVITGLFEIVEKMSVLPSADPVTLTGNRKDKFNKSNEREARIEKYSTALKELRDKNK